MKMKQEMPFSTNFSTTQVKDIDSVSDEVVGEEQHTSGTRRSRERRAKKKRIFFCPSLTIYAENASKCYSLSEAHALPVY
jgi:hypothetical protein